MKVAIPCVNGSDTEVVFGRFARAPAFLIIEIENGKLISKNLISNTAVNVLRGAAIQVTNLLISNGINAVIANGIGPNAFYTLKDANVIVYDGANLTIGSAIKMLIEGKLNELTYPRGLGRGFGRGFGRGGGRGFGRGFGRNW